MIKFDKAYVLLLQQVMLEATGGEAGVRDVTLLESALESAYVTYDGQEMFPSKEEKAARIGFGLVNNHAFVDGNKRIGIYVMLSFLEANGIHIDVEEAEIVKIGLALAASKMDYESLLHWIKSNEKIS